MMARILSGRHIRIYTGEAWMPIRRPVNLSILEKIDEEVKPHSIYYTQGRFFRPQMLSSRGKKGSFFLYQDQIIVDVDRWDPDTVLRMSEGALYVMFTGRGFHFCYERPRFENEEVMDPRIREERAYFNNVELLKKIAEERQANIDMLPDPRQLFKVPHRFKYANRFCRVWWGPEAPSKGELMTLVPGEKNGREPKKKRAEKGPGPLGSLLFWTNNVIGTRCFVLFAFVSRRKAAQIVERYDLSGVYFEEGDYLMSLDVMNRERVLKILRREGGGLSTFIRYGHMRGLCEGEVSVLRIKDDGRGWSRGHVAWLRFKGLDIPRGAVGSRKVKFLFGEVREKCQNSRQTSS